MIRHGRHPEAMHERAWALAEWDAVAVHTGRALHTFATVDRGAAGPVPTTWGLGDRAVSADVCQVEADHAVIGVQREFVELFAQPGLGPQVQASADRAVRALVGGYPFVPGSMDQRGDEQFEHDPVRDPAAVATEGMARVEPGLLGTQRGELEEDRFEQR